MAETVNVPAIGPVDKRLMWGSLAAAGVFLAWMYYRQSSGSGGGGAETPAYDPDAVGVTDYVPPASGNSNVDVPAEDNGIDTDSEWVQAVVESLSALGGWDQQAVAVACGRYLGRQTLTATEVEIIRTARGLVGEAPSGPHPLNQAPGTTPPPTPDPVTEPRGYGWYRVVKGDSISGISKKLNVSVAALWTFNGLNLNRLTPGEYLKYRSKSNPRNHPYNGS